MSDSLTVCNSSCLIVLDAIGRLDLLQQLLGTITIRFIRLMRAECDVERVV